MTLIEHYLVYMKAREEPDGCLAAGVLPSLDHLGKSLRIAGSFELRQISVERTVESRNPHRSDKSPNQELLAGGRFRNERLGVGGCQQRSAL